MPKKRVVEEEEKKEGVLEDVDIYLEEDIYVKTINGDKLKVPRLVWGKEIKLAKLFGKAVESVPKLVEFMGGIGSDVDPKKLKKGIPSEFMGKSLSSLPSLIPEVAENIPEVLTRAAGVMLDKDDEWVENNLDFNGVFELVFPFFVRSFGKLVKKMGVLGGILPGVGKLLSQ